LQAETTKTSKKMSKVVINSFEDFQQYVGQELGVSDYVELDQERINLFADATLDHQWIHVDAEKAKQESPFGQTIAHGYLTLSLLPYLWDQIIEVNNLERMMNYGMDAMKFAPAKELYDYVLTGMQAYADKSEGSARVFPGVFGGDMKVEIVNDGPITIWVDSRDF
jgi:hypothetical protein